MSDLEHPDINWVRIDTAIMLIGKYSAYDEQEFREDMHALLRRSKQLDELTAERNQLTQMLATERDVFGKRAIKCLIECKRLKAEMVRQKKVIKLGCKCLKKRIVEDKTESRNFWREQSEQLSKDVLDLTAERIRALGEVKA